MAFIVRHVILLGITGLLVSPVAEAQSRSRLHQGLSPAQRQATNQLVEIVDALEEGEVPGGDAWLKWRGHFLRAQDGSTYAPFTVVIDEALQGFDSVGLYVRAVSRTADEPTMDLAVRAPRYPRIDSGLRDDAVGPTSFAADGEQPMGLRPERGSPRKSKYDAVWFVDSARPDDREPKLVRGSLSLPPGEYDIYVAVGESHEEQTEPPMTRQASMVRRLTVPDLSGDELSMSSIIVNDHVDRLDRVLSRQEQVTRPYAFGGAELTPKVSPEFTTSDHLSLMFFVYNLLATKAGSPDASVEYHFYSQGIVEELFVVTQPQEFSAETLPPGWRLESENAQLPVSAEVPLAQFTPGPYRLRITLTDNLAATSIGRELRFSVVGANDGER